MGELLKRNPNAVVLDVRDRRSFSSKDIPQAVNIPLDELRVRASNELSPESILIVVAEDEYQSDLAYTALDTQGFFHILMLLPTSPPRYSPQ